MPPKGYVFKPLNVRVFEKVVELPNGCWEWTGFLDNAGYARVQASSRDAEVLYVHRLMFEHYCGPIPEGCEIDHLCRHRWCVNPIHLDAVPHTVNAMRGGSLYLYGTCEQGHALNRTNTYWRKDRPGLWNCRQCRRDHRARAKTNT
jgi:hypothetical protein